MTYTYGYRTSRAAEAARQAAFADGDGARSAASAFMTIAREHLVCDLNLPVSAEVALLDSLMPGPMATA